MKRTYLCLVVCSLIACVAQAADIHNIRGAYVSLVNVDTVKQIANVVLDQIEVPPPPVDPIKPTDPAQPKPRLQRGPGDGPMPITPRNHPGPHALTLDLRNDTQRRAYALLLAARDSSTVVDAYYGKKGGLLGISLRRGLVAARSEGHLNVRELRDVVVEGLHFCLIKNVLVVELAQAGGCESTNNRCDRPALSLTLDGANAADAQSIDTLVSAYGNYARVNLGFTATGELSAIELLGGYAVSIYRPRP